MKEIDNARAITKTCVLIFIIFTYPAIISAQCPDNIFAASQAQLENLMEDFPNCEHLAGYLSVHDVSDLSSLAAIKTVGEYVHIRNCDDLSSLTGLENLTSVAEYVEIQQCSNITSLQPFGSLATVGEKLELGNLPGIATLEGLGSLVSIGGDLDIHNNDNLESIAELISLDTIGGDFVFQFNQSAEVISGPANLTKISGRFHFWQNNALTTVAGFDNLTEVGSISIQHHDKGINFEGLRNIVTVTEGIHFGTTANVDFEMLQTVGGSIDFPVFVEEVNGLTFLMHVGGTFRFQSSKLLSIPSFPMLETIGGDMWLRNDSVRIYGGFNALTSLGGDFHMKGERSLNKITGFENLTSIGGSVDIRENYQLTSIEGFKNLTEVGGDFTLRFNSSLSDCSPICPLLDLGNVAGEVTISSNGVNCKSKDIILEVCDRPFQELTLLDANPKFYLDFLGLETDPRNFEPEDILQIGIPRVAISADSVTQVILVAKFKEAGFVNFKYMNRLLDQPWGQETIEKDGAHFNMAILNGPEVFPGSLESARNGQGIAVAEIEITIDFVGDPITQSIEKISVVRPPVVLVHGTFSNPESTWATSFDDGATVMDLLTFKGFKPYTVDYRNSNGDTDGAGDNSSFDDNKSVIWDDDEGGGIKAALEEYRSYGVAVTRADVIGHSLGGVLPRVYASTHYNADYKRPENFMRGDINRLITIAGTHFGSHIGELQVYLDDAGIWNVGVLGWMANEGVLTLAWLGGKPLSKAVRDQLPPPHNMSKLSNIGPTKIPSHAITCSVPQGMLMNPEHEADKEYYDLYSYLSLLFYYNATMTESYLDYKLELCDLPNVKAEGTKGGEVPTDLYPGLSEQDIFKGMFIDAIDLEGKIFEVLDGEWEMPSDIQIFKYVTAEMGMSDWDPLIDIFVAGANPVGVAAGMFWKYIQPIPPLMPPRPDDLVEAMRFMVFNGDDNDGTVRVESQSGELEIECPDCVTHMDKVFHSSAPKYASVQNQILELLDGGLDNFNEKGFPAADHVQTLYYPPTNIIEEEEPKGPAKMRAMAICQSGMVKSHALAFEKIADQQNTVIIVRPVNPDATLLIEQGAATKEMDVKPKSSNWGPQKGYLPVNQRYSKLSQIYFGPNRDIQIAEYTAKADSNIASGLTIARQLKVDVCNEDYFVRVDSTLISGNPLESVMDEVVLVPINDPSLVCYWGDNFDSNRPIDREKDCIEITALNRLAPLEVMANPTIFEDRTTTPRFLTADYDLLMIGFHDDSGNNPYNPPQNIPFMDKVGQITPRQQGLLVDLNEEVKIKGYSGGKVSHHGPENQFSKSPYIDYPLTVFLPGEATKSGKAEIRTIHMGKKGFRDVNLKDLVNEMRKKGYDLYDNTQAPGWHWTWSENIGAFELEDSPLLNDYVEEVNPPRVCDSKTGSVQTESTECTPPSIQQSVRTKVHSENLPNSSIVTIELWPNPVYTSEISLTTRSSDETMVKWKVVDAIGAVRLAGKMAVSKGESIEHISISGLESGMYHFVTSQGFAKTFVRM